MTTKTIPPKTAASSGIEPFTITISPFVIEDLRERLVRARWPDEIGGSGWQYGTNREYLQQLCRHWADGFDWKEQEAQLNTLHHYRVMVDGFGIHFVHEQGQGAKRIPLLLVHGWPDSFVRFLKLIPLLTAQGPDGLSFDVIVPSIPGFGFSDKPAQPGMNTTRIAGLFAGMMRELGYARYLVHGGDWGSSIAEQMAIGFPEAVMGIHLADIPYMHMFRVKPDEVTEAEKKYLQAGQQWSVTEGAYAMIQGTKPQSLAYGLNDSPAGLAGWIIEKFYSWTDHSGDLEKIYTRDEMLVNLTLYWVTQTVGSACRIYYETMAHPGKEALGKIDVPTAVLIAPKDLVPAPRELAERVYHLTRWNRLPEGGHFLAMERPGQLADDLFQFAATL